MLGGALDYDFVAGDDNSVLTVTCKKADGSGVIDLTGTVVTLRWSIDGATKVEKTMTSSAPATGVATYTFGTGDLVAGMMTAEVIVTAGGKKVTSLEPFVFTIRPVIA
jgi:hypothetical protein